MGQIPVFGFSAFSGTGKTTLIEKLVGRLKEKGLRVAVIKHDGHEFDIDHSGKDSWRFTRAGADISLITSASRTAFVERRGSSLLQAVSLIRDVDLILVEGWKLEDFPQIGLCRRSTGKGFPKAVEEYTAVVTDRENIPPGIPKFSFDEIEELIAFMLGKGQDFTHFNGQGRAKMVDVGDKPSTRRTASAAARVIVNQETYRLIETGGMKKGDVLTVAQISGIMGAKHTPDVIPMCHPILLDGVNLSLKLDETRHSVEIVATVACNGSTGVEMEALTAASIAALTVYDMCKAVQKDITITDVRLLDKTGGVHGNYHREEGAQ